MAAFNTHQEVTEYLIARAKEEKAKAEQIEQMAKDAARYRWLREQKFPEATWAIDEWNLKDGTRTQYWFEAADAAIDAAMK